MDRDVPASTTGCAGGRRHMSKIWYCPNCGYEVDSRGRCHLCRQRLVASSLPELPAGGEEDEVGYRLDDWIDRERGRLIERLNRLEILHRFEEDELVVAAEDESRVDDLVAELAAAPEDDRESDESSGREDWAVGAADEDEDRDVAVGEAVQLLADAAGRLRRDPTDMHADADVAEASAAVFIVDRFQGVDEDTWAAVGRVTRRLLSALGADEALEDEIRSQAAVLEKLLAPLIPLAPPAAGLRLPAAAETAGGETTGGDSELSAGADAGEEGSAAPAGPGAAPAGSSTSLEGSSTSLDGSSTTSLEGSSTPSSPAEGETDGTEAAEDGLPASDETVYELPEWLPEQRAQLGVLLDDAGVAYEWDGDDLVVPSDREREVESLFERVGGLPDEDDDDGGETRYRALEEMFAAADRLAGDPADEQRAADAVARIQEAAGPPPFGMDEIYWFRIMTQARALSESIDAGRDEQLIADEAAALRDLLRTVV
jgi:hypothetical protein